MNKNTTVHLENPWSGHPSTMTWGEVENWAKNHIRKNDVKSWLRQAEQAAQSGDTKTLGKMIIGS